MDKHRVLRWVLIANYFIWILVVINVLYAYPPNAINAWIYGIAILSFGFLSYVVGLFLAKGKYIETFGAILLLIGEVGLLLFFGMPISLWFSMYLVIPAATFLLLTIISHLNDSPELGSRQTVNWAVMLVAASCFVLMVEAAMRMPDLSHNNSIPTWGIITIVAGLLIYGLTNWKVFERPSYVMALTGAFIVNIGILMIEIYYQLAEKTGILMLVFVAPAAVFFLLLLLNAKISPG